MDGVTILREVTEATILGQAVLAFAAVMPTVLCCGGTMLRNNGRRFFSGWRRAAGAVMVFLGVFLALIYVAAVRGGFAIPVLDSLGLSAGTGKYEAQVSENIDMNEFYERYDILSCENGVYVIEAKN